MSTLGFVEVAGSNGWYNIPGAQLNDVVIRGTSNNQQIHLASSGVNAMTVSNDTTFVRGALTVNGSNINMLYAPSNVAGTAIAASNQAFSSLGGLGITIVENSSSQNPINDTGGWTTRSLTSTTANVNNNMTALVTNNVWMKTGTYEVQMLTGAWQGANNGSVGFRLQNVTTTSTNTFPSFYSYGSGVQVGGSAVGSTVVSVIAASNAFALQFNFTNNPSSGSTTLCTVGPTTLTFRRIA